MYGAVLGDIIGSRFEFDRGGKTKDFELFTKEDCFTDDSVMTAGVAEGLMKAGKDASEKEIKESLIKSMQRFGRRYPYAGYGARFILWVHSDNPEPYNSWGNGSAMRVSSVGWLYGSLKRTLEVARWTAEVSHNHPEGIKGAQCTAAVIYLARIGMPKEKIKEYVIDEFGYDLHESLDELRRRHEHVESCQDSLPKALVSFFEGDSYEDVVRNAVSLGGDTDTLGAIAGAMAEGMYEIPQHIIDEGTGFIPEDILKVIEKIRTSRILKGSRKELTYKVKELREQGLSYRKIGEVLGISGQYVHVIDKPELYDTEEKKQKHREYKDKRKDENLAYGKKWRDSNPDYMKEWYQANKDKYIIYKKNREEKLK